jgi:hypothetical protein
MTTHPRQTQSCRAQNDTCARTLQFVRDSGVEASVEQIQALELFISRRYAARENGDKPLTPNVMDNTLKRIFGDTVSFYRQISRNPRIT